jgi:hypothetical protein
MSHMQKTKMQRLQDVLDCHGADIFCWPPVDQELLAFIKENRQAERLFLEAGALDQLLDLAVCPQNEKPENNTDLQRRILADFSGLHRTDEAVVVAFGERKQPRFVETFGQIGWLTAAALAASFAFGIYLGGIGVGDWTLDLADSIASLSGGEDQMAEIADYVMSSGLEEDLL